MFATFAATNTTPQLVTPTMAFLQEQHSKTFPKIGCVLSVVWVRETLALHKG